MKELLINNIKQIFLLWTVIGLLASVYSAALGPDQMSRLRIVLLCLFMLPIILFILVIVAYSVIVNAMINKLRKKDVADR